MTIAAGAGKKKRSGSTARTFVNTNPVTGDEIATFQITTPDEVNAAVARARAASAAWKNTPLERRLQILAEMKAVIARNGESYARRISEETGKPLVDSLMTELMSVPIFIDYYIKHADRVLRRRRVRTPILFPGKSSHIEHFPMGVIGVISPWNFPFQLAMVPVLSALIAGNTVVLKPSEVTPVSGEIIREIFAAISIPVGAVQVIQGDGSTGAALVEADVDKIFFTGSVATGRRVMAAAAAKPIPVELELGGKDAMIICADANLKRAAKAAVWGGLVNCGQMCVSVERILVVDEVHDEFVRLLAAEVDKVRQGAPDEHADIGPMIFGRQVEVVDAHVRDARERGAVILSGGEIPDGPGQYYPPTLVTGVTAEMDIYREETFGPVLPVVRCRDEAHAIELANDHQYGLNGSVWTRDISRGMALASQIEAGQVSVNDLVASVGNPAIPFGGVKNSGFGRYHGAEGLLSFSHTRSLMVDRGFLPTEPFWFPYAQKYPHMVGAFRGLLRNNMPKALASLIRLQRISLRAAKD